ncbi:MAG: ACP S-malonyltransferase [Bacteroidia bacterium]|nr:ACP S-malonyltransferase [Bacteroidia bacterium]
MKQTYLFPGQGSQFTGMGKALFESNETAKELFRKANEIIGFDIAKVMFEGSEEELKQTRVTQPAIFIHSVIESICMGENFKPDMAAGHSLGEFSALTACGALSFEEGLKLVVERANAMQFACELKPSTMAAILGLSDDKVELVCETAKGIVVAANFNCPGQVVISGEIDAVKDACEKLTLAGAKRTVMLQVGGAFHSPLMEPARERLAKAIAKAEIKTPVCPVYQNCDALPSTDSEIIKQKLIKQLTAPVRWTQTIENMINDGATTFAEIGPGKVLSGLVKKINRQVQLI